MITSKKAENSLDAGLADAQIASPCVRCKCGKAIGDEQMESIFLALILKNYFRFAKRLPTVNLFYHDLNHVFKWTAN